MNELGHDRANDAPNDERIAIIGGGITGLFCAYVLARSGRNVEVFESSDRFGGRIRSFRLSRQLLEQCEQINEHNDQQPNAIGPEANLNKLSANNGRIADLDFCAEFGPMRVELDVQVLLKLLLSHLNIAAQPQTGATSARGAAHLEPFPAFSSPTSASDPVYQLRPEEEGKNPLELLCLALCRVMVYLDFEKPTDADDIENLAAVRERQTTLVTDLGTAVSAQVPTGPVFDKWAKSLREKHYWVIQRYGLVSVGDEKVALYTLGFWNLMANCLSHDALTKVRDLGTFYHLLPENPNAAEWLTWWLRALSISSQLQGIYGGMEIITDNLLHDKMDYSKKMRVCRVTDAGGVLRTIKMHDGAEVTSLDVADGTVSLQIGQKDGQRTEPGSPESSSLCPRRAPRRS